MNVTKLVSDIVRVGGFIAGLGKSGMEGETVVLHEKLK